MQPQHDSHPPDTRATPLRILHLEDNVSDRQLVRMALVDDKVECEFVYATTEAEFAAALDGENFDLILSDFTLPGYNGAAALALAQQKCPGVPYLFVSGTIGEERAIESLKNGATDYVLKERLERLLPAVRRALRDTGERAARRAAEEALRRAEARFRDIFENAVEGIYQSDPQGRLLAANRAMARLCGYASPEELCACVHDLARDLHAEPPRYAEFVQLLNAQGRALAHESLIRRKDGVVVWTSENARAVRDARGGLLYYESMVTDITARKTAEEALRLSEEQRQRLEAQLFQAQKMEAVGQLAGGLAHDFNNVLSVVIGYARLLLDREVMPFDAIKPLTEIFNAGNRAANLTRQLLVFSSKETLSRRALDLNCVASEMADMLRRVIGEHIRLELTLPPAPSMAEADAGMMEQVLMNLAVNARDAMPHGGTLTIVLEPISVTDSAARQHPGARAGRFVCLSVRDTGCGIPPDNLRRIFEPFFTTKAVGRGTGLGLAMVFGIVQKHQGWIEIESTVGAGTCFRILLPAVPPATVIPARRPAKPAPVGRGSETILLVEDDPAVREFAAAVLQGQGYRVLQAASGVEALEVWKWHGPRIALLFTDVVMPDGLGGVELATRLRKERPSLRVVLTSGYAKETDGEEFHPPAGMGFIHKPSKPQILAQTVRDALDDKNSA